ncbi:MAG: amino acid-binding protein [Ruminococcaceae bacterium]|nr:amino acid-binding protein [Oscillospiraceae bacterium]
MAINQITVFLENKAGSLLDITKILSQNKVDLRALNIAETADYGLLRMITADNISAEKVLKQEGLIFTEKPVLAVAIDDKPGALSEVLEILAKENIDVHYMYSIFGHQNGKAYMIMQVAEIDKATQILKGNGVTIAEPCDLQIG